VEDISREGLTAVGVKKKERGWFLGRGRKGGDASGKKGKRREALKRRKNTTSIQGKGTLRPEGNSLDR